MANGIASLRGYQEGGPPVPQERPDSFLDRLKKLLAKLSPGDILSSPEKIEYELREFPEPFDFQAVIDSAGPPPTLASELGLTFGSDPSAQQTFPRDTLTGDQLMDAHMTLMQMNQNRNPITGFGQKEMWDKVTNPALLDTISTMIRQKAENDPARETFERLGIPYNVDSTIQSKPLPDIGFFHQPIGVTTGAYVQPDRTMRIGRNPALERVMDRSASGFWPWFSDDIEVTGSPGSGTILLDPVGIKTQSTDWVDPEGMWGDQFPPTPEGWAGPLFKEGEEEYLRSTLFHEMGHWNEPSQSDYLEGGMYGMPWNDIQMGAAQAVADTYTREDASIDDVIDRALNIYWESPNLYKERALESSRNTGLFRRDQEETFRNAVRSNLDGLVKKYLDIPYYRDTHPAMRNRRR
tara:strand:- start:21 stop:1244 length:1224 start_codon:yes stop_codon:yes gene_type:complete